MLNVVSMLVAAWVIFFPHPYALCITASMGFALLLVVRAHFHPARYSLLDRSNNSEPASSDLTGALGMLGSALTWRAFSDFSFAEPVIAVIYGCALGVALGALLWASIERAKVSVAVFVGLFYGYAVIAFINSAIDLTPRRIVEGSIMGIHVYTKPGFITMVATSDGRRYTFVVNTHFYRSNRTGGTLCFEERRGLLWLRMAQQIECVQ
jgi:hypothetical protein